MKTFVFSFCGLVNNISLAFEGRLGESNSEVAAIKAEVISGQVPSISQDKENLRSDGRMIASDLKKAFNEYVEEHA